MFYIKKSNKKSGFFPSIYFLIRNFVEDTKFNSSQQNCAEQVLPLNFCLAFLGIHAKP